VLESDSTPARKIAPTARLLSGREAPRTIRRHGQHTAIIHPGRPRPPPVHRDHPRIPASPGWTARPPSGTLEPVTAPAGARAAHLSPPTPARDHPHPPRRPSFAGTPRRQDPSTAMTNFAGSAPRSIPKPGSAIPTWPGSSGLLTTCDGILTWYAPAEPGLAGGP